MQAPKPIDDAIEQLRIAGWSIGSAACTQGAGGELLWLVCGHKSENTICAEGKTEAQAWTTALDKARALEMLRLTPGEPSAG